MKGNKGMLKFCIGLVLAVPLIANAASSATGDFTVTTTVGDNYGIWLNGVYTQGSSSNPSAGSIPINFADLTSQPTEVMTLITNDPTNNVYYTLTSANVGSTASKFEMMNASNAINYNISYYGCTGTASTTVNGSQVTVANASATQCTNASTANQSSTPNTGQNAGYGTFQFAIQNGQSPVPGIYSDSLTLTVCSDTGCT